MGMKYFLKGVCCCGVIEADSHVLGSSPRETLRSESVHSEAHFDYNYGLL